MHCALKPSHRPCYPMLQAAHGVPTPLQYIPVNAGSYVWSAEEKLEEKSNKNQLLQDHQHNNQQQSTHYN